MFTEQPQAQQDLAKPINCPTAEGHTRVLQSEKAKIPFALLAPAGKRPVACFSRPSTLFSF